MFSFFARKAWTSVLPRSGGARRVTYDPAQLEHNPSITWIGHSTFFVRMDGMSFLTDPIFSERASPVSFAGPKRLQPPGVPLEALPHIDFVTVSHDHYDHADLPTWKQLARRGVLFIVPLGMGDLVHSVGGRFVALDWWQSVEVGPLRVHCVPAQHFSGRSVVGHNRRLWCGFVVEGPERKFFHAGDTGYFSGFRQIGERFGTLDLAAVPIGAYDPPAIMQFVHMNPEEAVQAAKDANARRVVAMHWGTFDLTDEALDEPPRRFRKAARALGYDAASAWVLAIGETKRW
jgi:N-acyl-phosphatidylethanolamine-hydrolysing phospholipase D